MEIKSIYNEVDEGDETTLIKDFDYYDADDL